MLLALRRRRAGPRGDARTVPLQEFPLDGGDAGAAASGAAPGPPGSDAPLTVDRFRPLCHGLLAKDCGGYRGRFQLVDENIFYPTEQHRHYNASWIAIALCALKDQRQPGLKEI